VTKVVGVRVPPPAPSFYRPADASLPCGWREAPTAPVDRTSYNPANSNARWSLALPFFCRRSGGRGRSLGHPRRRRSHLVRSRRLLNWPSLLLNPRQLLRRPARFFNDRPLLRWSMRLFGSRRLLGGPPRFFDRWSPSLIWPWLTLSWRLGGNWFLTRHRPVHSRSRPLGAVRLAIGRGGNGGVRSVRYARPLENPGARVAATAGSP
jgi:hypothetical protein